MSSLNEPESVKDENWEMKCRHEGWVCEICDFIPPRGEDPELALANHTYFHRKEFDLDE